MTLLWHMAAVRQACVIVSRRATAIRNRNASAAAASRAIATTTSISRRAFSSIPSGAGSAGVPPPTLDILPRLKALLCVILPYYLLSHIREERESKKNQVLRIPFNRLVVKDVPKKQNTFDLLFSENTYSIEISTKELVDLIHAAAIDPNIVALEGNFGGESTLEMAGWADLEEVRAALKVFKESHRVHTEPNLKHPVDEGVETTKEADDDKSPVGVETTKEADDDKSPVGVETTKEADYDKSPVGVETTKEADYDKSPVVEKGSEQVIAQSPVVDKESSVAVVEEEAVSQSTIANKESDATPQDASVGTETKEGFFDRPDMKLLCEKVDEFLKKYIFLKPSIEIEQPYVIDYIGPDALTTIAYWEKLRQQQDSDTSPAAPSVPLKRPKLMYAVANALENVSGSRGGGGGNKDYYLASIFTNIYLHDTRGLNLFGLLMSSTFYRDFLEKYKIKVDVFQHGAYKNMGNSVTENKFTEAHRENLTGILLGMDEFIHAEITESRLKQLYDAGVINAKYVEGGDEYKQLMSFLRLGSGTKTNKNSGLPPGAFTAETAKEAGLIDGCLGMPELKDYTTIPGLENIPSNGDVVDFEKYLAKLRRRKALDNRKLRVKAFLQMLNLPVVQDEKIALIYVGGGIHEKKGRKVAKAIREIGRDKDVKAVVLRVTSPGGAIHPCTTITEELKALKVPYVVSMGNVAASGGYHIAAHADRIFASNKTITGSIGVIGMRPDFNGISKDYGVRMDHCESSDYHGMFDVFQPMTKKMKKMYAEIVEQYYKDFKAVVASGRNMTVEDVHELAEGRVYTGDQAKDLGLVDEIGGLSRALAYAERSFTKGGVAHSFTKDGAAGAKIKVYDIGEKSWGSQLLAGGQSLYPSSYGEADGLLQQLYSSPSMGYGPIAQYLKIRSAQRFSSENPGIFFVCDERTALFNVLGFEDTDDEITDYLWD